MKSAANVYCRSGIAQGPVHADSVEVSDLLASLMTQMSIHTTALAPEI